MKKVTFGPIDTVYVENVSKYFLWESSFYVTLIRSLESILFTREIYNEKRYLERVVQMVSKICDHEDVYHVDIYIDKNNKEDFIKDLSNIMDCTFGASKNSNVIIGETTRFCFKDGYSNPSFDQNFKIDIDWSQYSPNHI